MESERRKRGRPRGPEYVKYQICLDKESGDWGKAQPGGLSALIRRLIRDEKREAEAARAKTYL
jgi:hypothetical protein